MATTRDDSRLWLMTLIERLLLTAHREIIDVLLLLGKLLELGQETSTHSLDSTICLLFLLQMLVGVFINNIK